MFLVDTLILVSAVLLTLGILSSKFSARFGIPVLVLFLGLGMLAGSEGIGGIHFESYELAHAIGTLALALILFDGGLSTPLSALDASWKPAALLATLGVLITAMVTGWAAAWILDVPLATGLLLGSIVGSTDAAAVFAILRSGGVRLSTKMSSTLEVESASNDPMAIFLTVGMIEVVLGRVEPGWGMLTLFVTQMGLGGIVGVAVGIVAVWAVNRINLETAGFYPGLVTAAGLMAYGVAAAVGGSGFLAVYLAGIVIGNRRLAFRRGILLFHNAAAWLAQIVMFVVLGLLSFPSRLLAVTVQGLLIAAALTFLARPIAVLVCVLPFRFNWRELTLLSAVGLKGAVPITLATFPLMMGVPDASLLFDVVFFVVVVSALLQGWSLPYLARALKLDLPLLPPAPVTLELTSLREVEGDIVDYTVGEGSQAAGRLVRELALPEGVVIALLARGEKIVPPHGNTRIEAGDHAILVLTPMTRPLVDRVFARRDADNADLPALMEFPLRANITVREFEDLYGIPMGAPAEWTLGQALREKLGKDGAKLGASSRFGQIELHVRGLSSSGSIERVGMTILPEWQSEPEQTPSPEEQSGDEPAGDESAEMHRTPVRRPAE